MGRTSSRGDRIGFGSVQSATGVFVFEPRRGFRRDETDSRGIPICFPQFGKLGTCAKQHGFARHSTWDFISSETNADECWAKATFSMSSNEDTLKEFPFKFTLKYTVCIEKEFLHTKLEVTNDDSKEFEFTTALHTYFTAKSINDIAVKKD